jgi:hypothetical protein
METIGHLQLSRSRIDAILQPIFLCTITVVVLHLISALPRNPSNFALVMLKTIVSAACVSYVRKCGIRTSQAILPPLQALGGEHAIPSDIRTAIKELDLDPEIVTYACCPSCFYLYPPMENDGTTMRYPTVCTARRFLNICNARLTKPGAPGSPPVPIKPFTYQPFESWLSRMLARPDFTNGLETTSRSWSDTVTSVCSDIFGGRALRDLLWSDGKPFVKRLDRELRLVFTMNIDWFNPLGRKTSGKHGSIGAIYMVCMNLPPHMRYRVENVYLAGIIPGPREPTVNTLNHVLTPLITRLVQMWNPGVFFSWTAAHPFGCLVRCAVIALVCDLPALRKAAGFVSHAAHLFCSFCQLLRKDIANLNPASWPRRTFADFKAAAERYRDAPNQAIQKSELAANGVRWTQFLLLPYWDTKYASLDSMHNLLLGNLAFHTRRLLGMDHVVAPHKTMKPHATSEQQANIDSIYSNLTMSEIDVPALRKIRLTYIAAFIAMNNIQISKKKPTKQDMIDALITWVSFPFFSPASHVADVHSRNRRTLQLHL